MTSGRPGRKALSVALLSLFLAACGGLGTDDLTLKPGGEGAAATPGALAVATSSLPAGSLRVTYPDTTLSAVGEVGAVDWARVGGALPPGLALSADGRIAGTPQAQGRFPFIVLANDGRAQAVRTLEIAVDELSVAVEGLTFGDAWTGTLVRLIVTGHRGPTSFVAASAASGGRFGTTDPAAGTATWVVGSEGGEGIYDRLRVEDPATGRSTAVDLSVMPHPCPDHQPAFGVSDVWHIKFEGKFGDHDLPRDWDHALASVGLRSRSPVPTEADDLSSFLVRREVVRHLNRFFLRDAGGTEGADGLPITFTTDAPPSGYQAAVAGAVLSGAPTRYSVISVVSGKTQGVAGTAYLDSTSNSAHENNTPGPRGDLGVFADRIAGQFTLAYGDVSLLETPVGASDLPALRALVYGLPDAGGRSDEIRFYAEGFGRSVAAVAAHEIGHSLGLLHSNPTVPGSIMNGVATISRWTEYFFTSDALTALRTGLPGPGRLSGSAKPAFALVLPDRGVEVCSGGACHLRLR
jgi:hypothetical protein